MVQKTILIIFIFIGIFLRIYQIEEVPPGLFADEISLAINAKTIAQNGTDEYGNFFPFGFEAFTDYKYPGYIYPTAIIYKILGPRTLTVRLVALISSIASIFLLGYLARLLFPKNKFLPYYAMVIISLSPFHLHFSRIAYETMLATTLFTFWLVCFYKILSEEKVLRWFVLGTLVEIYASFTYPGIRLIIPVFLVIIATSLFLKPRPANKKQLVLTLLTFAIIIALTFLPSFLIPQLDRRPLSFVVGKSGQETWLQFYNSKLVNILASLLRTVNWEYLFLKGDLYAYRHGTKEMGLFLLLFFPSLVMGIISLIKNFSFKNLGHFMLLALLIATPLPSALSTNLPYATRILPIVIPFTLIMAYGTDNMTTNLVSRYNLSGLRKSIIGSALCLLLFLQTLWLAHVYLVHFSQTSIPEFPAAPKKISQDIHEQLAKNPSTLIYFLNGYPCFRWSFDFLQLWYFANLDNKQMIIWNNILRQKRLESGLPFDSFDFIAYPQYQIGPVVLNSDIEGSAKIPSGSWIVRCGIHLPDINPKTETIEKVYYLIDREKRDPFYVLSRKN